MTVLIVDDSKIMRMKLKGIITASGLTATSIREASDGHEALKVFDAEPIDIAFIDINMPGMDGRQLLKELASRTLPRTLFKVVCTTETPQALKNELQPFGVDLYIEKPFDGDAVKQLLARAVVS